MTPESVPNLKLSKPSSQRTQAVDPRTGTPTRVTPGE
jgi:hypothetical protein